MSDNTPNAMLADEATQRYYESVSAYRSSEYSASAAYDFRAGWEAAAALRAPTTADDARQVAEQKCDECGGTTRVIALCRKCWFDTDQENIRADNDYIATIAADAAARMRTEMIAWRDHWVEASRRAGGCGSWDEAAAKLDRWITALAMPSPTIAEGGDANGRPASEAQAVDVSEPREGVAAQHFEFTDACALTLAPSSKPGYETLSVYEGETAMKVRLTPEARSALHDTVTPTIAEPSPSNEVDEAMGMAFWREFDALPSGENRRTELAIEAALKARKPSPSQADDAALNDPCIEEIEAVASALYYTQDPINPTPFNVACHPECVELSKRYKRDAALAISVFLRERREILRNLAALAERGANDNHD